MSLQPVCTTELGYMAKVKPEFGRRNAKIFAGTVSDDEARTLYPDGWQAPRSYIRIVPQPNGSA